RTIRSKMRPIFFVYEKTSRVLICYKTAIDSKKLTFSNRKNLQMHNIEDFNTFSMPMSLVAFKVVDF
ncbi:MAG TPA: hypothetical protein VEM15_11230, partial [Thermodesulfobacteriota bacterium]|nr:hypothetical protein [Thermodesulfobacteriota bacterium]